MIDSIYPVNYDEEIDLESDVDEDLIESIYLTAVYFSLGATLVGEAQASFDEFIKKACTKMGAEDTSEKRADLRKILKKITFIYNFVHFLYNN